MASQIGFLCMTAWHNIKTDLSEDWNLAVQPQNRHISTTKIPIATKLGRVVTYHGGLPPIKSRDLLATCFSQITWQIKPIVSPLLQCLWSPKLAGLWQATPIKSSYLTWRPPTHDVTWPFDDVVLWNNVSNWSHYISITTVLVSTKLGRVLSYLKGLPPVKSHGSWVKWSCKIMWQIKNIPTTTEAMVTKFGRAVTYHEGPSLIKSNGPLIKWSCKITWQTETFISPLPQFSLPPNLTGWWITLRNSRP